MPQRAVKRYGDAAGHGNRLRNIETRILFAALFSVALVAPQQAGSEAFFRFKSLYSAPSTGGPTTPETPQPGENDTLTFARSSFAGERNVPFGTGVPSSTLPNPITFSLASESSPLPEGLSVESSTGEIAGNPTQLGTFPNIVIAGVSGARSAKAAPSTIVITGLVPGADEVLPSSVTLPGAGTSKLNASHLLGQYVPSWKPRLDPGASLEITYSQPVQVDGVHLSTLEASPNYRVEAEVGGSWRTLGYNLTHNMGAKPVRLGTPATASRFRIVNTGTAALTNLTAGLSYKDNWAQLPFLTVSSLFNKLTVGQSFSAGVSLFIGPMGYGNIVAKHPFTYSITPRAVNMPQVGNAYFETPDGIEIDPSTGVVSGTATTPTWVGWTTGGGGMLFAQTRRDTYVSATDADGYTVYGYSRTFVVDSQISAGTVKPTEITVNGVAVDAAMRDGLTELSGSVPAPAGTSIIAKYGQPVSVSVLRMRYSGTQANWSVFVSQDSGAHWMPIEDTETTNSGITTAALADPLLGTGTGSATGSWIMVIPNRTTTLRGLSIGKDGIYPIAW